MWRPSRPVAPATANFFAAYMSISVSHRSGLDVSMD
jgi:hypothetical protein